MIAGQGNDHGLLLQRRDDHALSRDLRGANKRNIHLVVIEFASDLVAQSLFKHQRYHRESLTERADRFWNQREERRRGRDAYAKTAYGE